MCGICGIHGLGFDERRDSLPEMLQVLRHRGPDDEGSYTDEFVSLGSRRLSIIDLKTGSQPIYNEDKSIILVCNGEIYNFSELRERLIKKGHQFHTKTDVEVIVHLYEELGADCLKELRGMFAFALWDKSKKLLFLARDRLGIKPLYYFNRGNLFAFASELKALLKLSGVSRIINPTAVDLYFSLEYVPSPFSIFEDVFKLKPGHYLIYRDAALAIRPYWELNPLELEENRDIDLLEAVEKLKSLLGQSVSEHLVSDVPLGVFLSGGIDSSTLTALTSKISNGNMHSCSVGFVEDHFDESRYAQTVSRSFNTQHHHFYFTVEDFTNIFPQVVKTLDEPFGDMSIFPTQFLCKEARSLFTVVLSGEGSDELFMGYPTYPAHQYMERYQQIPKVLRKWILSPLINGLPVSFEYFSLDFKLKQFIRGQFLENPYLRHFLWMGPFSPVEKESLYSEDFKKNNSKELLNDYLGSLLNGREINGGLKGIQYLDIFTYLSEDLLVKADRAGMASSLEIRVPYLDHRLIEFAWSLPSRLLFQKRMLKSLMKNDLPFEVLNRPKKGFAIPFSQWIKNKDFFALIEDSFSQSFVRRQNMFNSKCVKKLLDEHLSQKIDNRKKLGAYIMFQEWYRNYFN